ncbi:MAG: signal peptidase I [Bacilli bacterium]|nr:signal peptidase I [Bacilli bacterium]
MEKNENKKKETIKTILTYVFIIIAVIIIRVFFIDPVRVDGESMNTTLSDGEIMLLNKIVYRKNDIQRFDIVVIDEGDKYIIKRVIALPGETIEYKNNVLYINGKEMKDPYPSTETDDFNITDIGHIKVPGDTYFVMGDNRSDSLDSRYPSVGVIKKDQILGRAKFVIWPFNKFGKVE